MPNTVDRPIEFYRDPSRFDEIGIDYQHSYGRDEGLVRFVGETLAALPAGGSVLDIGCGTGRPVCEMAVRSGRRVTGIDYSSTMISLSRQQVPQGTFRHVNMLDYEPEAAGDPPFDAAYSSFTLLIYAYDDLQALMVRIGRWIAAGGQLFIITLSPAMAPGGAPAPDANGTCIVDSKFFGINTPLLLPTADGWRTLLARAGLELTHSHEEPWTPPPEADSNEHEVHLFLKATKLPSDASHQA